MVWAVVVLVAKLIHIVCDVWGTLEHDEILEDDDEHRSEEVFEDNFLWECDGSLVQTFSLK